MVDQEGSETSGVSPNNNPRPERPASYELIVAVSAALELGRVR